MKAHRRLVFLIVLAMIVLLGGLVGGTIVSDSNRGVSLPGTSVDRMNAVSACLTIGELLRPTDIMTQQELQDLPSADTFNTVVSGAIRSAASAANDVSAYAPLYDALVAYQKNVAEVTALIDLGRAGAAGAASDRIDPRIEAICGYTNLDSPGVLMVHLHLTRPGPTVSTPTSEAGTTALPTTNSASTSTSTSTSLAPSSTGSDALSHLALAGVTIDLPSGWVESPSPNGAVGDHVDYLFTDPNDVGSQLLLISSDCSGCASSGPINLVPSNSFNVSLLRSSLAAFQLSILARAASVTYSHGSSSLPVGYATNGVVRIAPPAGNTTYAIVVVTLPTSQTATASRILNSVGFM